VLQIRDWHSINIYAPADKDRCASSVSWEICHVVNGSRTLGAELTQSASRLEGKIQHRAHWESLRWSAAISLLISLFLYPFPPWPGCSTPSSPTGSLALAWSWPFPQGSSRGSALIDLLLYPARLASRPDDWRVRTSETLLNLYQSTRDYNPEDNHLPTHSRKNLKSYIMQDYSITSRILYKTCFRLMFNASLEFISPWRSEPKFEKLYRDMPLNFRVVQQRKLYKDCSLNMQIPWYWN
jgi:hypothetical protein